MFISQARSPIGKSVRTRQGDVVASFVGNTGRFFPLSLSFVLFQVINRG